MRLTVSAVLTGALFSILSLPAAAEGVEAKASLLELFGEAGAKNFADILPADHEFEFEIYEPEGYDPSRPAGMLVFVSPTALGEIPDDWEKNFDESNLIWIAVKRSGNKRRALRRIVESLASASYLQSHYAVDPDRYFLAGFSGGGRISSYVAMFYPEVFNGVLYICGVDPLSEEPNAMVDEMKGNRFVFLSGTEDFNLRETRKVHREYKEMGFDNIKLMVIPNMGHAIPSSRRLGEALKFLEGED